METVIVTETCSAELDAAGVRDGGVLQETGLMCDRDAAERGVVMSCASGGGSVPGGMFDGVVGFGNGDGGAGGSVDETVRIMMYKNNKYMFEQ